MLPLIKSAVIIKKLFSHIFEGIKLNLVRYNKKLQNTLNISLINYKIYYEIIFGLDISYENNAKGKIYDLNNDRLIYEGELLNGKKNGRGKEYVSEGLKTELIFEGEYLNGKKNGKGKEYDYGSKFIFEGEYLNGQRWKGKGYDYNGKLIFEGEYLNENEIKEEKVQYQNFNGGLLYKYTLDGNLLFEGEYLNGEKNGNCKEYNYGKLIFEGGYLNGEKNGKCKEYNYNGKLIFEG